MTAPFDRKYFNTLFHFFLVLVIYSFWFIYSSRPIKEWSTFIRLFSFASVYLIITYTEAYILFKRFFLKDKKGIFLLSSTLLYLIGSLVLQRVYEVSWKSYFEAFRQPVFYKEIAECCILFIAFSGFCITHILFNKWAEGERRITTLAQANLKAELENLKRQISPHFLFNTLNNLHVLAKTNAPKTAAALIELAELMRYQLYECNHEKVLLKKELDYISNLLALEQLRKEHWLIQVHLPAEISETWHIEPLLFITLIENAIKHGSEQLQSGIITVQLRLQDNNRLHFEIINSKPRFKYRQKHPAPIGLENLRRRLSILYPDRHKLSLQDQQDKFIATLTLEL